MTTTTTNDTTTRRTTPDWDAKWYWPKGTRVSVQFSDGIYTGIVSKENPTTVWVTFDAGQQTNGQPLPQRTKLPKTYGGLTRLVATTTKKDGLFVIEKHWDGNVCETEGANGRTYVSNGRWQWLVIVDGETDSAYDTKREAVERVAQLERLAG